ncbi:MAG: hypothetical protein ABI592_15865 [Acidobacteriota bacterium]
MSRRALALAALVSAAILLAPEGAAARRSRRKKPAAKSRAAAAAPFDARLPVLGTKLSEFPAGSAKAVADGACLVCHSADIVVQQRLTEKQWGAEVTKMIGWGADVHPDRKDELVAYLVKNFGGEAPAWEPVVTRPVGR